MPKKSSAVGDAAGRYALSLDAIGAPAGSKIAYEAPESEKEALAKLLGVEKTAAEVEREHVFAIENASLFPHRYARVIALQRFDGLEWLGVDASDSKNLKLRCPSMADMLSDLQSHANDVPDTIAELFSTSGIRFDASAMHWAAELHRAGAVPGMNPEVVRSTILNTITVNDAIPTAGENVTDQQNGIDEFVHANERDVSKFCVERDNAILQRCEECRMLGLSVLDLREIALVSEKLEARRRNGQTESEEIIATTSKYVVEALFRIDKEKSTFAPTSFVGTCRNFPKLIPVLGTPFVSAIYNDANFNVGTAADGKYPPLRNQVQGHDAGLQFRLVRSNASLDRAIETLQAAVAAPDSGSSKTALFTHYLEFVQGTLAIDATRLPYLFNVVKGFVKERSDGNKDVETAIPGPFRLRMWANAEYAPWRRFTSTVKQLSNTEFDYAHREMAGHLPPAKGMHVNPYEYEPSNHSNVFLAPPIANIVGDGVESKPDDREMYLTPINGRRTLMRIPPSAPEGDVTVDRVVKCAKRAIAIVDRPENAKFKHYLNIGFERQLLQLPNTQRAVRDVGRVVEKLGGRPALVSAGPMKSLLQKLIRAGNPSVEIWGDRLPDDGERVVALTWVATMVVFGFNAMDSKCSAVLPEQNMQRVRGQTSALKRLGVILLEDAWPQALPAGFPTADACMETLLGLASVTANEELGYHINDDVLTFGMLVAASAACSSFSVPSACSKNGEKRLKYAQHLTFDLTKKLEVDAQSNLVMTYGHLLDDIGRLTREIHEIEKAATMPDPEDKTKSVRRAEYATVEDMRLKVLSSKLAARRKQLDSTKDQLARTFAEFDALNQPYPHDRNYAVEGDLFTQQAVNKYVLTSIARSQFQPAIYNDFGDMLVRVHVPSMQRASAFLHHTNSLGGDKLMFERAATLNTPLAPTGLLHNPIGNGRVAGLAMVYSPMICAPGELVQLDADAAKRITHIVPHAPELSGLTPTVPRTLEGAGVWNRVAQTDAQLEASVTAKFTKAQVVSAMRMARAKKFSLPAIHLVDQHAYRAIGHMMQTHPYNSDAYAHGLKVRDVPDSFQSRFETIFRTTTGFNPRSQLESIHEKSNVVMLVREAQKLQMSAVLGAQVAIRPPPTAKKTLRVGLPPSLLGGGVGAQGPKPTSDHFNVKSATDASGASKTVQCVVTIGTLDTPELVVFAKPSGSSANKTQELSNADKDAAKELYEKVASTNGLQFKDGMLADYKRARFEKGKGWTLERADESSGSVLQWTKYEDGRHVFAYANHFVEAECTPMSVGDIDPRTAQLGDLIVRASARYLASNASGAGYELYDVMDTALCDTKTAAERLSECVLAPLQDAALGGKLNARMLAERMLALANGAVNGTFELPLPNKDGGRAADKLEAVRGDWHLYRAFLVLTILAPGALVRRRNAQASFYVRNQARFRYTIDELAKAVRAFAWRSTRTAAASSGAMVVGDASAASASTPHPPVSTWQSVLQKFGRLERRTEGMEVDADAAATTEASEPTQACTLLPHQTTALQTMMRREGFELTHTDPSCMAGMHSKDAPFQFGIRRVATTSVASATPRAQLVSFATGLGKTIVAALYALLWSHATGSATHILWLCPSGARNGTIRELQKWGFGEYVHEVRAKADKGSKAKAKRTETRFTLREHAINIVDFDDLSSSNAELAQVEQRGEGVESAMQSRLVAIASSSFVVVDEMHDLYSPAIKTSVARAIASSAVKYVAVTATPTPKSRGASVAIAWLQDTVTFPINAEDKTFPHNRLTALATAIQSTVRVSTTTPPVTVATNDIQTVKIALRTAGRTADYTSAPGLELGTPQWDAQYHDLVKRLVPHFAIVAVGYGLEDRVQRIGEAYRIRQDANDGKVEPVTANTALRNLANQQLAAAPTDLVSPAWNQVWDKITGGALVFVPSGVMLDVQNYCNFLLWYLSAQVSLAHRGGQSLSFNAIANANQSYSDEQKEMAAALVYACNDLCDPRVMRNGVGLVPKPDEDDVRVLKKYFTVPGLNGGKSDLYTRLSGYRERGGRENYRKTVLGDMHKIDPFADDMEIAVDVLLHRTDTTGFVAMTRDPKNSHPAQGKEPATPDHTPHAGVVVQSTHYVSSYNFQHFSTCIFGVFPSSIAQRHQLMGRILRLGQERPTVIYKKLVPINTILSVLDERHERGDAVQSTFQSRSSHVDAIVA